MVLRVQRSACHGKPVDFDGGHLVGYLRRCPGRAYFMNGSLFISKPPCCSNLSIAFYVMDTGSTNGSFPENVPTESSGPCVIATFNTLREAIPLYGKHRVGAQSKLDPVMVPARRTGVKQGKVASRWQEGFSRWNGKYLSLTSFQKDRNELGAICRSIDRQHLPSRGESWRGFSVLYLALDPNHPSVLPSPWTC